MLDGFIPCGTCEGSMKEGKCAVTLTYSRKAWHVESACEMFTGIQYANAVCGSKTTPCTNVPMVCMLPGCYHKTDLGKPSAGIWSYNMEKHIRTRHPAYKLPENFESDFLKAITISPDEQKTMGIPQGHITLDFFASLTPHPTTSGSSIRASSSPKPPALEPLSPARVSKAPQIANQAV